MKLDLPRVVGPEREAAILDAVRAGRSSYRWTKLRLGPVELEVMAEPIRISGILINASARTAQLIADQVGALLPTPKIVDSIWQLARWKPSPCIQRADAAMANTDRMVMHSQQVDAKLAAIGAKGEGLIANCGKYWTIGNLLLAHKGRAQNYGWHDVRAPYLAASSATPVWQPIATAHDIFHVDYSQTLQLVSSICMVSGETTLLEQVLSDAELCQYVSHEGPLKLSRQPGVE